jgi:hypothetical protein
MSFLSRLFDRSPAPSLADRVSAWEGPTPSTPAEREAWVLKYAQAFIPGAVLGGVTTKTDASGRAPARPNQVLIQNPEQAFRALHRPLGNRPRGFESAMVQKLPMDLGGLVYGADFTGLESRPGQGIVDRKGIESGFASGAMPSRGAVRFASPDTGAALRAAWYGDGWSRS